MAKKQTHTWAELEFVVRIIASHLYNRPAQPELINGVKCDCVVKIEPDNWVLVEITESRTLEKLRTDLAKFAVMKPYLITKNTYAKCFFITKEKPNDSLVETGKGLSVDVLSVLQFSERLFHFSDYNYSRMKHAFGSAVDPVSGEKDETTYTPVFYTAEDGTDYNIKDIAKLLIENNYVVLLGNYGTGKSRCIQELFIEMVKSIDIYFKFPIAINLKENWGLKRATEIITRHLSDLGLSHQVDAMMKVYRERTVCFLLDGFDEIGSQSWSDNPEKLKEIRAQSLFGVKDLLSEAKGGAIIAGREHYFNSNEELMNCLGLSSKSPIILRCKDEFSEHEMEIYLGGRQINAAMPKWLPRRPLICQVINELTIDATESVFSSEHGEVEFWELLINTICERETRIHGALDPTAIKKVLIRLARTARSKQNDYGPVTLSEIYKAFEDATGSHTTDETAIMLQRLPGLGRVGPESLDRQFVEQYLLDGLRGEGLIECVIEKDQTVLHEAWRHPLRTLGLQYVATKLQLAGNKEIFLSFCIRCIECNNKILIGDILAGLSNVDDSILDFHGKCLENTTITILDLSVSCIKRLCIKNSIVENMNIADSLSEDLTFENCIFLNLMGVSSSGGLPIWIKNCEVEHFDAMNTISRIRTAKLNPAQLILLSFIRKLFLQHGAGRKEAALLRGLGDNVNKKLSNKILKLMLRDKMIEITLGYEGNVYVPNRSHTQRLKAIIDQMTLSKDKLWLDVSHMGERDE